MIIDFLTVNLKHALADEVTRAQSAETALRAESFASAVYDSGDTAIYFYNADDEVLSTIDCTDFIVDGMIDNVTLEGSILTITFNTDSGKQDITIDLSEFINPENYYTKDEVNSAITEATEDFVTSGEVETQITSKNYITSGDAKTQIESYGYLTSADTVTSGEVKTIVESYNYITSGDAKTQIESYGYLTSADTVTSGEVKTIVESYNYVNSGDVETQITNKNYVTSGDVKTQVEDYHYITSADTVDFVTSGDVETQITNKNYITSGDAKTQIEDYHYVNSGDVKTQVEAYHYITSADTVTSGEVKTIVESYNYVTSGDVESQISEKNYITSGDAKTQIEAYNYVNSGDVKTQVEDYHYITSADTANFVTSGEVETQITNKNYVTSGDVKTQIEDYHYITSADTVDFVTSGEVETQITNKNYITSADTADFVTSGDVENQITAATSGLQETLVSGTNIKTINNQSLLGSGNITIQGGGGSGGTAVIELTKQEYAALSAYAPDTFYVITDADSVDVNDLATSGDIVSINTALSGKADAVTVTPNNASYLFPKWNNQGVINGYNGDGQFYTKSWNINGSGKTLLVQNTAGWYDIFAPNTAGSQGQPLLSNGSGAPVWGTYKFQFISQSAYDAITTKDSNTIYFIIDEN